MVTFMSGSRRAWRCDPAALLDYPAQFLGLGSELGRIAPGYRANLVLVDDAITVQRTWIECEAY